MLVIPPLLAFGEQAREQLQEAGYPVEDDFLASDYKVGGSSWTNTNNYIIYIQNPKRPTALYVSTITLCCSCTGAG